MRRQTVFIGMTPTLRLRIETTIENLLALLDEIDGDPDLEPWLAGGAEVVGTDDREQDDCDLEEQHDAEPCPDDYGEIVMWRDDLKSQEVLVRL
ncbi:hypothetical protein [Mesorhizobium sp.]|uniref:hypothetical protein n=1 Tax=Mesorhizobium sp. TaxID=1871066 RepID=UPI00121F5348|nr:hypothetical protein [Mesorhizobium sp.]TIO11069.1 MAG: hypothetical protein E5X88_00740 [Mesorhizobium sp.]TIO32804.1 MAG: hypothetical protein E5X89_17640 [Mesorhizobium sp.]TIP13980.1 MAG: hypothetical protein E5X73_03515 [Mesorhizobium sp.]TIP14866.1 MAG: hypothetical protein E5X73_02470 [Mesorhizobium sp.]